MSTFDGEISEIAGISVDHFVNVKQKCYFLSHCHTDHMRGLALLDTVAPIYATPISALIVRRKFSQLDDNLRLLEVGAATSVELDRDDGTRLNFVVTAIPAGHCPGSCMLLFQIEGCDILYTGDFRMSLKNIKKIKLFDEIKAHGNLVVYLDSTFMKLTFPNFPSQTESVMKIVDIAEAFIKKSRTHKVFLHVPARYGYEYLLMELSRKMNEKIYVCEQEVFDQYLSISQLESCVTMTQRNARIFLKPNFVTSNVKLNDDDVVMNLRLSAMFWANWKPQSPFVLKTGDNSFRICYATHNSYNEIRDFLLFLKPKKVNLNVEPENATEKLEMSEQLKKIQREYQVEEQNAETKVDPPRKFSFKRIRSMTTRSGEDSKL